MRRIIITMIMLLFATVAMAQLSTTTDCVQCGAILEEEVIIHPC